MRRDGTHSNFFSINALELHKHKGDLKEHEKLGVGEQSRKHMSLITFVTVKADKTLLAWCLCRHVSFPGLSAWRKHTQHYFSWTGGGN